MPEHKSSAKHFFQFGIRLLLFVLPLMFALAFALQFLFPTRPVFRHQNPSSHLPPLRIASHVPADPIAAETLANVETTNYSEGLAIPGKSVVAAWEWGKRKGKGADYFNDQIFRVESPESRLYFDLLDECGINRLYLQVKVEGERLACNESYLAGFLRRGKEEGIEITPSLGILLSPGPRTTGRQMRS